ncbi:MAG TPA: MarR family transcriptional regulator [Galbitalea sp.]|jgi:DNA-binding MarR family transcriptional regulator|nr:MarR family transcriptional regulator [Galbitalea sp.]
MARSGGGGFGYALLHAAQVWRTEAGAALAPHELTVPQFLLVMALYRQHRHAWLPLTQAEIAIRLGMDANTTSQVARGLETRGLILRSPHPDDARARALSLTPAGVDRAMAASAAARAFNDRFFSAITVAQQELLGAHLESLTEASEKRS